MVFSEPGSRLTHEYLRNHPDDAARVLERLPAEAVSALFDKLPARLAAPALGAMVPYAAARCLAQLAPQISGALLTQSNPARASAILRHLGDDQTEAIYAHMPSGHALRIRRLRSYPEDTVGAWVDSDVIALTGQHSVAEAEQHLRSQPDLHLTQLYVIDARRQLLGTVTIGALLHADPTRNLATLSRPAPHSLSTRMSLTAARRHRSWANLCALPVLQPDGEFVGELRLGALQHAHQRRADTVDEPIWLPALETLTGSYCATAAEVVGALISWSMPERRRNQREH